MNIGHLPPKAEMQLEDLFTVVQQFPVKIWVIDLQ